ncbi:dihydrofolate reductase family protein [Microbacterium enclense]|uniref:Dihydrofolate reductase n=1 Tax=Microbacterium enclense TaxID=993073 RepID=A0A1G6GL70_9MICO|nr:dihydrofolate reductase family protein [Microbacterium enclense]KSU56484.1 deaminase [Microbacterium enclense]SDB82758.1 Dihydrofolate reductase [Microbacterium enclense]
MAVDYTWDVFSTLDGYGSYEMSPGESEWGGYWGKQGPELLAHRAKLFRTPQRMIYGATTFRKVVQIFNKGFDPNILDEWNRRLVRMPATVLSSTLNDTLGWPDATIDGDAAEDVIRRLKRESDIPLRSQASLSLNWSLLAAGLVDRIQVTIFPVISGRTGVSPIFDGLGDYDLDLLESRLFDGHTVELTYRPTARTH